jgi:hypothetical protein
MCHSALHCLSLYESQSSILSSWSFCPHPLHPGYDGSASSAFSSSLYYYYAEQKGE